jgi:chromate transport protein ChrA
MFSGSIPRLGTIVRIIGGILLVPSLIGMALAAALMIFFAIGGIGEASQGISQNNGAALVTAIAELGFAGSFVVGVLSFVGGLLGWLLLMKRKVYKCVRCGFILDRA